MMETSSRSGPVAVAPAPPAAVRLNVMPEAPIRSVREILRANLLTRFNALLGALCLVTLVVGPVQDAVFGLILVANTGIAVLQELRAKRALERLRVVARPQATVLRDGLPSKIAPEAVVEGDLVVVAAGDPVPVDGEMVESDGLELGEALLTGESEPVAKAPGDGVLSGSYAVAGRGVYRATAVGADSYAGRLTVEARRFQLVRSELMAGINAFLRAISWVIVPVALLLVYSQLTAHPDLIGAVRGSVAGIVTLVPEGLVLLTSVSLAVSVARLARRGVLVQQLAAVEVLARADVVCFDKTGTLTTGDPEFDEVVRLDPAGPDEAELKAALGALAAADPAPNLTLRALGAVLADPGWRLAESVPFSSARRWSAARFEGRGTWVLGAPDAILPAAPAEAVALRDRGRRVLLLATASSLPGTGAEPAGVRPVALAVLSERLNPDAAEAAGYLAEQGMAVKLISGDHPSTVRAAMEAAGLQARRVADGRRLPETAGALGEAAEELDVIGRAGPDLKRRLVEALRARGHVVAMLGDGVNDVPALKAADIALAMGRGSAVARGISAVVLARSELGALPRLVGEGRTVIANIERLAGLFLSKTVYALILALAVSMVALPFPFHARQLTLVAAFSIGIPSFFIALGRSDERARPGFVGRTLAFAVPAGAVAAAATFTAYRLSLLEPGLRLDQARTAAVLVIGAVGLWLVVLLIRPLTRFRLGLLVAMAAGFLLAFLVPLARDFFALSALPPIVLLACVGVVTLAVLALEAGHWSARTAARLLNAWRNSDES